MIYKSIYSSPLGFIEICADGGGAITRMMFTSTPSETYTESENTRLAAKELAEYFSGERKTFDFPLALEGTEFQKTVWKECARIPYAETRTQKEIAVAIGDEKAVKAVGSAVEANPVCIAVPDHRVIGKSGFLARLSTHTAIKEALRGAEKNFKKRENQ